MEEFNFDGVETQKQEKLNTNIFVISKTKYKNFNNTTLDECIKYVKKLKKVSVDIETTRKFGGIHGKEEGLNPYLSKIVMFQVGDLDTQFIIDTRDTDISSLIDILKTKQIIGQNLKFEYKHVLHNYKARLEDLWDTMIAEQVLNNGLGLQNSLKALIKRYLDREINKDVRLGFLYIRNRPFTDEEILYGAHDIIYPLLIKELQEVEIEKKGVWLCAHLEFQYIPVLGDIEYNGMNFNANKWRELYYENLKKFDAQEIVLNNFVIDNLHAGFIKTQYDLFDSEVKCNIKWTSSQQVIEYFKYLGICPIERSKTTKKMAYTVEAKVLKATLKTINKDKPTHIKDFIKEYLKYKELEQATTTFGIKFLKYVNPVTGRLHSNYKQIVNTGRMSSSSPNLQNIPSDDAFRACFDVPDRWNIINADFTGQEQVVLANKSMDKDLIDFYDKDLGDMHSYVCSKIYPEISHLSLKDIKKLHPDKRQIAKSAGFAINYGGTGFTIANNLGISSEEGDAVYDAYFKAFPGLKRFFDEQIRLSMSQGYIHIDNITNRKFFFKDFHKLEEYKRKGDTKNYMYYKGKFERACLNYIIQGAAGSITKLAGILFRKWLIKTGHINIVKLTNIIHDELNVESPIVLSKKVAPALEQTMKDAGYRWCKRVILNADAVITDHWTH